MTGSLIPSRPTWANRVVRAYDAWHKWSILPGRFRMDRALKEGGFRDIIKENSELRERLARAAYVAEHLAQMIDADTWRASGGDDGQGHYEGDYHAEKVHAEIESWKELADA